MKRFDGRKTIFTSIISNSDNLNINSNTNINSNNNNTIFTNNNTNFSNNVINLNQNSVYHNSSYNKNLISQTGIKSGATISQQITKANKQQKGQLPLHFGVISTIKVEKPNQGTNPKIIAVKKRNYSDNNPQQQTTTNEINNHNKNNHNNSNNSNNNSSSNNFKNAFLKTINFNKHFSFIEQKPSKNLSPKNILDVYNSNKIKNNSNKESLNSANLHTHINSNSNSNIGNNLQKNPLSVSLCDVKHSAFNKNSGSLNPSNGSINFTNNKENNMSGKDLKIVNAIKQSVSLGNNYLYVCFFFFVFKIKKN